MTPFFKIRIIRSFFLPLTRNFYLLTLLFQIDFLLPASESHFFSTSLFIWKYLFAEIAKLIDEKTYTYNKKTNSKKTYASFFSTGKIFFGIIKLGAYTHTQVFFSLKGVLSRFFFGIKFSTRFIIFSSFFLVNWSIVWWRADNKLLRPLYWAYLVRWIPFFYCSNYFIYSFLSSCVCIFFYF